MMVEKFTYTPEYYPMFDLILGSITTNQNRSWRIEVIWVEIHNRLKFKLDIFAMQPVSVLLFANHLMKRNYGR